MEILPFKAYRLDPQAVGDVARCIAPPFDLIDQHYQQYLYDLSPHNVVRIEKGIQRPSDSQTDNVYTRAAACLSEWISTGILRQDPTESIYAYTQQYRLGNRNLTRYSFIALGRLMPLGDVVKPHEQVFAGPVQDRLRLKRATRAQLGLVFMLYQDHQMVFEQIARQATHSPALLDAMDDQGVRHVLHAITRTDQISAITQMMADRSCIIADGHHRYATGLQFARESDLPDAAYQMMAFANAYQEGMTVLATDRVIRGIRDLDTQQLLARLAHHFDVESIPPGPSFLESLRDKIGRATAGGRTALGLYLGGGRTYALYLRDLGSLRQVCPGKADVWYKLDVVALQVLVLDRILQIDPQARDAGPQLQYVTDIDPTSSKAAGLVDSGQYQLAFILNPIPMQLLVEVTHAGLLMPPKSTYFYPKMYTGLTIQKLNRVPSRTKIAKSMDNVRS